MKKIFTMAFCICLFSVLILPSSASQPDFSDASEIDNWEEVCLLYDLGLISGFEDGTFLPDSYITRAEAAKIVAIIIDEDAGNSDASDFPDLIDHWAAGYVQFCTDRGMFSGFDDGTFLPEKNITAEELAKILLMTIGCDGSDYTGIGWADAVNADAEELGLYDGFHGNTDEAVTRDNACLLIFNALNCYAVETSADGTRSYATDQLLNPVTILENRFGVVRYEEYIQANEYADLENDDSRLEEGCTKLNGHREFAFSTDLSMLGRRVEIFVLDNTIIGIPCLSDTEAVLTCDTLEDMYSSLKAAGLSLNRDTSYYLNYNTATAEDLDSLGEVSEITLIDQDNDGKIDMVLAVSYVSATVLNSRDLTLQLDSTITADTDDISEDTDTADDPDEADEEDSKNSESDLEQTTDTELTSIILSDDILLPSFRLHTGDQVWVAYIGGRYMIRESD